MTFASYRVIVIPDPDPPPGTEASDPVTAAVATAEQTGKGPLTSDEANATDESLSTATTLSRTLISGSDYHGAIRFSFASPVTASTYRKLVLQRYRHASPTPVSPSKIWMDFYDDDSGAGTLLYRTEIPVGVIGDPEVSHELEIDVPPDLEFQSAELWWTYTGPTSALQDAKFNEFSKIDGAGSVPTQKLGFNLALPTTQAGWSRPYSDMGQFTSFYHATGSPDVISDVTGYPVSGNNQITVTFNAGVVWPDGLAAQMTWTGAGTVEGNASPHTFTVSGNTMNFNTVGEVGNVTIEPQAASPTLTTTFTDRAQYGECFRWMESQRINEDGGSGGAEYDDSNPYVRKRIVSGGNTFWHKIPTPEIIAEVSMNTSNDAWICFHHRSTTATQIDFVNRMIAAGYNRKLYIELSNEVWNSAFPQHAYLRDAAIASGNYSAAPGDTARLQAYYFDLSDQMAENIKAIYANTVAIVASQTATPNFRNNWYDYGIRNGNFLDAYAVSWYAGGPPSRALSQAQALALDGQGLADLIWDDWINRVCPLIETWKGYADEDQLTLHYYEGGSHADNSDPTAEAHLATLSNSNEVGEIHGRIMTWIRDNNSNGLTMAFQEVGDPDDPWSWQAGELAALTSRRSFFNHRAQ